MGVLKADRDLPSQYDDTDASRIERLAFRAEYSMGRSSFVDLYAHPLKELAKSAFIHLREGAREPNAIFASPGELGMAASVFRKFGRFCFETNRTERVRSFWDIGVPDIDAFEDYLVQNTPKAAHRYLGSFFKVLALGIAGRAPDEAVVARMKANRGALLGKYTPKDAYSDFIIDQVVKAAKSDVRETKRRMLEVVPDMLNRGVDPDSRNTITDWRYAENALWAIVNKKLTNVADIEAAKYWHLSKYAKVNFGELLNYVYMSPRDAFPFAILIALGSGLPAESVRDLQRDCIFDNGIGDTAIRFIKRRKKRSDEVEVIISPRGGEFSPVSLIETLLDCTKYALAVVRPKDAGWLFVGQSMRHLGRFGLTSQTSVQFCQRHGIVDDNGGPLKSLELARLRKTHKAKSYREFPELAPLARDHSQIVHDNHYAQVESLRKFHEQALEDAFTSVVDRATRSKIVTEEPSASPKPEQAGERLDLDDVWTASCKDVHNSPYNEPNARGRPCQSPVWGCLSCPNAVISTANLPAIIAFQDHLDTMLQLMPVKAWGRKYGRAYSLIRDSILPRFKEDQIARARQLVEVDSQSLLTPVELTS